MKKSIIQKSIFFCAIVFVIVFIGTCEETVGGSKIVEEEEETTCATSLSSSTIETSIPSIDDDHKNFSGCRLTFQDEFNATNIDMTIWDFDEDSEADPDQWGTEEIQYYTGATDDNAYTENGSLVIVAKSESMGGKNYTSARLHTHNASNAKAKSILYGVIEARIKLPATLNGTTDNGTWPAFWMLGSNFNGHNHTGTTGWPYSGEIDIMETNQVGSGYTKTLSTLHWNEGASYNHKYTGGETPLINGNSEYHIYTALWSSTQIKFYLDYNLFYTHKFSSTESQEEFVGKPFFILLNLAIDGVFAGTPNPANYPQYMYVDWVRVYQ